MFPELSCPERMVAMRALSITGGSIDTETSASAGHETGL